MLFMFIRLVYIFSNGISPISWNQIAFYIDMNPEVWGGSVGPN